MSDLILYYKPTCPYCQKVFRFMESAGITIPLKNTVEGNNRQELIDIGGKPQVPCLMINGEPLYESDDIVEWLKSNVAKK
jgi:glutaredoxin